MAGRIFMLGLSPLELGVIALVIVLLFGTRRLPELGSGLGKAITNFKKSYREGTEIDVTPKVDEEKKDKES
jgi:sec-independent protein translocase protein TatA